MAIIKLKQVIVMMLITIILTINMSEKLTVKASWFDDVLNWVSDTGEVVINDISKAADFVEQSFYAVCDNIGVFIDNAGQAGSNLFDRGVLGTMLIVTGAYTQEQLNSMSNDEIRDATNSYIINGFRVVDGKVVIPDAFVDAVINRVSEIIYTNEYYSMVKTVKTSDIDLMNKFSTQAKYLEFKEKISINESEYINVEIFDYKTVASANWTYYNGYPKVEKRNLLKEYFVKVAWEEDVKQVGIYDLGWKNLGSKNFNTINIDEYTDYWYFIATSEGSAVKVFHDLQRFKEWTMLNGKSNIYYNDSVISYDYSNDNSMSINKDTFTNNNWKTENTNSYNTINNHVENYYNENGTAIDTENLENILTEIKDLLNEVINQEPTPEPTIGPTPEPTVEPTPINPDINPNPDNEDYGILDYIKKSPSLFKSLADMIKSMFGLIGQLPIMFGSVFFMFPSEIKDMIGVGVMACIVLGVIKWLRQ